MKRLLPSLILILSGLWLGSHIATGLIGAPAMFRLVDEGVLTSASAGTAAGALFHGQMLLSQIMLVLLAATISAARHGFAPRARTALTVALIVAALLVLAEVLWITPQIHHLREILREEFGSVAAAPKDFPARRTFGMLHGLSMLRALGEMICAATVAIAGAVGRREN
ncbi:DUF4149 domain-containing protein [bacterium]|nr:DUF4149 domain-containing protein [bacterium]